MGRGGQAYALCALIRSRRREPTSAVQSNPPPPPPAPRELTRAKPPSPSSPPAEFVEVRYRNEVLPLPIPVYERARLERSRSRRARRRPRWQRRNHRLTGGRLRALSLRDGAVQGQEASRRKCSTYSYQIRTEGSMKTDNELRHDVELELEWEPSVDERRIGVSVVDGIVTLTGEVGSMARNGRRSAP